MSDNALVPSFAYDDLREWLREAERIGAAWAHEVGNTHLLLAVAIRQRYPGHARAKVNMPSPEDSRRAMEKFGYLLNGRN